ncbi:SseB family protein [Paenarthrobacter sp. Z7-10]|uniref:SseB family protein n=1 Tax=Paenarthrobacter sp. Z7-10 TaxID=2787635 RepID=UPI0022A912A9|nr:SseB family protein [Paenarthrobacter sp. Z7-10]MCZ2403724.1 SseB family protein [Paenarthrobacter sp. Z7-10]
MTGPAKPHLPGHIAAALSRAGGNGDSAGQPWQDRRLKSETQYHNFEDDDGGTDAGYAAALASLAAGTADEAAVVRSLALARVFVPIVAEVAETTVDASGLASDKESDMALVTIQAPDGRRALPVFSSARSVALWHPQARPVAVHAARAALSAAAEEAQLMVVDPGAEIPFVVRRPAVWALAQQQPWLPSYDDPQVLTAVRRAVDQLSGTEGSVTDTLASRYLSGFRVQAGSGVASRSASGAVICGGGAGPELRVVLYLRPGLNQLGVESLTGGLQQGWAMDEVFAERVDSVEISLRPAAV